MDIKLDTTIQDLIDGLNEKTPESIKYVQDNYQSIIDNEIESLERSIEEGIYSLLVVRDNMGEMNYTDDNGNELGSLHYWATVT